MSCIGPGQSPTIIIGKKIHKTIIRRHNNTSGPPAHVLCLGRTVPLPTDPDQVVAWVVWEERFLERGYENVNRPMNSDGTVSRVRSPQSQVLRQLRRPLKAPVRITAMVHP